MTQCFYIYLLASGPCGYLYVGVTKRHRAPGGRA